MGMRLRHRNPVVPGTQAAPALAWAGRHRDMPCLGKPPWYIDRDRQARGDHDRDGTSKRTDRPH